MGIGTIREAYEKVVKEEAGRVAKCCQSRGAVRSVAPEMTTE